jgi:hypothetical protein
MVGGMCFSIEADIVTGVVVTVVGIDAIRHVGHNRETAMAALPVIFGFHQLIEVFVWKGLESRASAAVAQGAAWLYLVIAFGLIPWLVPYAVRRLETDRTRRPVMSWLTGLGVVVAIALTAPIIFGPISVSDGGYHLVYSTSLVLGGFLAVLYVVATCGALILSSDRVVSIYGWMNLVVVTTLAALLTSGVISLWCVWAAVTSIAIAVHLRRLHGSGQRAVAFAGA